MTQRTKPKITTNSSKSYTKISFVPDYSRFSMNGLEDDSILLIRKRVLDCIACTSANVQIYLNGERLRGKGLVDYTKYFFDGHLRRGIEFGATMAHGAEVNVGGLKTNFFEPSISIYKIQVTDKSEPSLNIIEIGKIKLQLLWDALLRGKFVIPESSVLDIQLKSKRKRPGRILPPPKESEGRGMVSKAADQTINQLKAKNSSNYLSDLISIAGGTNYKDQLKKMLVTLPS